MQAYSTVELTRPDGTKITAPHNVTLKQNAAISMPDPVLFLVESCLATVGAWIEPAELQAKGQP